MTMLKEFNYKDCELIDAQLVNAYFDLSLDPADPTKLIFDNSWGTQILDLTPAIKAGETVTHLMLDPASDPVYLRYDNEAGDSECIHGDDLSRIISMTLLKDVDQTTKPVAGDVYVYNSDGTFHTYPLSSTITNLTNRVSSLENRATALENRMTAVEQSITALNSTVNSLETRLHNIEQAIFNWANDKTTKIARGNINVYGDINNNDSHANGIFTHATNSNITNDLYFS